MELRKIRQRLEHDCGVACLAMVARSAYEEAAKAFSKEGLDVARKRRAPFSSNYSDLVCAASRLGLKARIRRFRTWRDVRQNAIVRIQMQKSGNWHWVVATREQTGIVILDPAIDLPSFENLPSDTLAINFGFYAPKGCFIEIC